MAKSCNLSIHRHVLFSAYSVHLVRHFFLRTQLFHRVRSRHRSNGKNELSAEARDKIDLLLKRQFRPEFLNRLDDIVYYKSLTKDEIGGIVDLMLADLRSRLADKQLKLVVTDAAKSVIVDDGYDPIYGARPLKRYIQANVETMIAKEIIGGNHVPGDTLTVDAENGKLVLR